MAGSPAETPLVPPPRRVATPTMLAYGFGAAAYGVKDFCFITFLLLFYNQVVGLPSAEVGFVIMCALLLDAFVDPAIGMLSDRTRSRWGRRHPWMYAAAAPIALGWLLLWNPPAWSHAGLLGWLFCTAVLVRTAVSAFEVPSQALTPELSSGYEERTRIMAYRYLFGWGGGMAMLVLSYAWFLAEGPGRPHGQFDRAGYPAFALGGAVLMVVAILVSALGTHREIRHLPPVRVERQPLRRSLAELFETLRNPAFLMLMGAGLCYFTAQGISFSMSNYLYAHVWRFDSTAFELLGGTLFLGVLLAFVLAPRLARRLGKPGAATLALVLAVLLLTAPYLLRLGGAFPAPGSPWLLPLLFAIFTVNATFAVSSTMLGASMLADVVEHSEVTTGRRSEGVFFAGFFFVQKCSSGLGIFLTGLILSLTGFPDGAAPGTVPTLVVDRFTLLFCCVYLSLAGTAAFFYRRFPFGKAEHAARLAQLGARAD
ncbi:MFS transporter [Sphingomonas elodea]|uniref:MFS transporter n=1 Tax=Sphingomonas elodea TaxID=179878 RepID=UPI00026316DE|nr:MFS transporter [Sphingomonas elodea]